MFETLEAISQVAIGVAGFSGVIVVLQHRDPDVDFRLRSLLALAGEVIVFSFLPPLLELVVSQPWHTAALIYAVFHLAQVAWSYLSFRGAGPQGEGIRLDHVLMSVGAFLSVALFAIALAGPGPWVRFGYTSLLLWALGIAGIQFFRLVLRNYSGRTR